MPDRLPAQAGLMVELKCIAGSSNGRTHASGAWYRGSNPCPAADKFCPNFNLVTKLSLSNYYC